MKKISLLIFILSLCLTTMAQTEITFNFLDPKNVFDQQLRYREPYKVKLTNVNKFVYTETTAEQKGENLNAEPPAIFQAITLPTNFTSLAPVRTYKAGRYYDQTKKDTIEIKVPCPDCPNIKDEPWKTHLDKIKSDINEFNRKAEAFSSFESVNYQLERLKKDTRRTFFEINSEKKKIIKDNLAIEPGDKDIIGAISLKYKSREQETNDVLKKLTLNVDSFSNDLKSALEPIKDCITKEICGIDTCSLKYYDLKKRKACIKTLEEDASNLAQTVKKAGELVEKMKESIANGKIDEVQDNYNLLVHENFEIELDPFIADKDIHTITFTGNAGAPLAFGAPSKRTVVINAVTKGGVKVDYSTGIFFNNGSNTFLGPEYFYEMPTDSTKIIREAARSKKGMLSLGALMHFSYRGMSPIRPALSSGVSITSGFDSFNFHLGASVIIGRPGKPNRLVVSGGFTWREVELLNSRYSLGEVREDYPDAVPVSKNFPIRGTFVAITYNLKTPSK